MREELHMYGTQFNVGPLLACVRSYSVRLNTESQQINTIFTCGYIVGMIPSEYSSSWQTDAASLMTCNVRQSDATGRTTSDLVPVYADCVWCLDILASPLYLSYVSAVYPDGVHHSTSAVTNVQQVRATIVGASQ